MIYSRLLIARQLLREDGVIFISIDDNEVHHLRKLCDEVFGEENFIANIIWQKKYSPQNDAKCFSEMHDHIICYAKNKKRNGDPGWEINLLKRTEEQNRIWFGANGDNVPSIKRFLFEVKQGITPPTIWFRTDVGDNQEAALEVNNLFNYMPFDTPKPTRLLE